MERMEREEGQGPDPGGGEQLPQRCLNASRLFRTLSHPLRLHLLCLLERGEACVGDLQEGTRSDQSQVSQFLRRMEREGWVACRHLGRNRFYRLGGPEVHELMKALGRVLDTVHPQEED